MHTNTHKIKYGFRLYNIFVLIIKRNMGNFIFFKDYLITGL